MAVIGLRHLLNGDVRRDRVQVLNSRKHIIPRTAVQHHGPVMGEDQPITDAACDVGFGYH